MPANWPSLRPTESRWVMPFRSEAGTRRLPLAGSAPAKRFALEMPESRTLVGFSTVLVRGRRHCGRICPSQRLRLNDLFGDAHSRPRQQRSPALRLRRLRQGRQNDLPAALCRILEQFMLPRNRSPAGYRSTFRCGFRDLGRFGGSLHSSSFWGHAPPFPSRRTPIQGIRPASECCTEPHPRGTNIHSSERVEVERRKISALEFHHVHMEKHRPGNAGHVASVFGALLPRTAFSHADAGWTECDVRYRWRQRSSTSASRAV